MTKLETAAQTWAKIETILTGSAMPDDRITSERPRCIAIIADALGAKPPKKKKAVTPVEAVSEMWNDAIEQASAEKLPLIDFSKPVKRPLRSLGPSSSLESAVTAKLEQYMQRSCGYSEDDEVGYDRR